MVAGRTMLIHVRRGPQDDDVEVTQQTAQLRRQLLELDVDRVELGRQGDAPTGSKAGEAFEIGALVVTFGPTILAAVLDSLKAWVARDRTRTVEVSIDGRSIKLSHASEEHTERLVAAFLESEGKA